DECRRIRRTDSLAYEKFEEAAEPRQLACARARAESRLHVFDEELRDVASADFFRIDVADVRREAAEIARVRVERILREAALDAEVIEVDVDPTVEVHAPRTRLALSARVAKKLPKERSGIVLAHQCFADERAVRAARGDRRDVRG